MRKLSLMIITSAVAAASQAVLYSQPWLPSVGTASWESRVRSCQIPKVPKILCFDDMTLQNPTGGGSVTCHYIRWWGTVSNGNQLYRYYYISFYKNTPGACRPYTTPFLKLCIKPQDFTIAGTDCQQKTVYKFYNSVAAGFTLPANTKIWISIAESDQQSWVPGVSDFGWSGTIPVNGCQATALTSAGTWIQPLIDPCIQQPVDMAFEIDL